MQATPPSREARGENFFLTSSFIKPVRVGMEATGLAQWFEGMLAKLGHELWVGDSTEIRAAMVRKQKTDVRDALHILDLCWRTGFRGSGFRHRRSGMCDSYCGGRVAGGGNCWTILDRLDSSLAALDQAVAKEAEQYPAALGLMEQPGVGLCRRLACRVARNIPW
jgi:transposase